MVSKYPQKTYILHVWRVQREEQPWVIASLDDCYSKQRQVFDGLESLLTYLAEAMEELDVQMAGEVNSGKLPE